MLRILVLSVLLATFPEARQLRSAAPASAPAPAVPCPPSALLSQGDVEPYAAVLAPDWTALFDRNSGWTGADGVYSVPLSRDDRPCAGLRTTTFWSFSDTFIGEVNEAGERLPGTVLINNTQARLVGGRPLAANMRFDWNRADDGSPEAVVQPAGPDDRWLWPQDGVALNGGIYLFAIRLNPQASPFGAEIDGVVQLRGNAQATRPFAVYDELPTPLFGEMSGAPFSFGRALLDNTHAAGAPAPDGFVYLYGVLEAPLNKQLLVARFLPNAVEDFAAYEFWDGSEWGNSPLSAAPIHSFVSAEFSVTPLADGRFLLVYQQFDFLGSDVTVSYGASPVGPFGAPIPVYSLPEPTGDPDIFAYGAKAHPHLSTPSRLLISYHVNTFDFADHFADADIYRPRFIELPLPQ